MYRIGVLCVARFMIFDRFDSIGYGQKYILVFDDEKKYGDLD